MNSLIKNTINSGLVLAVLLSSSGLFLNRMDCLKSGESYYSLEAFGCCEGEESSSIAENCCDYEQMLFKLDIQNYISNSSQHIIAPVLSIPAEIIQKANTPNHYLYISDSSPPALLSGIDKLIQICILRL